MFGPDTPATRPLSPGDSNHAITDFDRCGNADGSRPDRLHGDDRPITPSLAVEDAGHNTADHFKVEEAINFELENPCNGELITFSGGGFYQFTSVGIQEGPDAGQPVHFEFTGVNRATGIGQESGATYSYHDVYHEGFNAPINYLLNSTFHAISDLPGLSFDGHLAFHFVAPPSGEFKVTREVDRFECKG